MDHIFVLAHKRGLRLGLPMYDGAKWYVPDRSDLAGFVADAHGGVGAMGDVGAKPTCQYPQDSKIKDN